MNNQKPSKQQLMNTINEVSFAVNDILLYLDTHPDDTNALAFYRAKMKVRKEALREYAELYGPLTIDTADDASSQSWEWVMQPWPWEGKGGCC
ncbi:MAG: spore coat protein CotJB [Lachnospiraceae bacterium]